MHTLIYTHHLVLPRRVKVHRGQLLLEHVQLSKMLHHVRREAGRDDHFSKSLPVSEVKVAHYVQLVRGLHQFKGQGC